MIGPILIVSVVVAVTIVAIAYGVVEGNKMKREARESQERSDRIVGFLMTLAGKAAQDTNEQ